jgi:expansin (peptidoglycan-binding protein)
MEGWRGGGQGFIYPSRQWRTQGDNLRGAKKLYDKIKKASKNWYYIEFKFHINKRYKFKEGNYINKKKQAYRYFLLTKSKLYVPLSNVDL